ncbi:DUF1697 domain-containing protein [bacterium]|nr:DUF1697 domain-containing protein [bacterium]
MEPLILMLRGVNVSGANRLPMAEFRAMLTDLGLDRVQTHVQSGNAVFLGLREGLAPRIALALQTRFAIATPVFLLGLDEMAAVLAANPFTVEGEADGAKVHIIFLQGPVRFDPGLAEHATAGERFHVTERALYIHTPQGFGTSALAARLPRYLKAEMTARNQRSASAILALARGLTGS